MGCLARGLARSGLAQAFDEWTRNSSREGETLSWSAESQEPGSEPLEMEDSAWCACIHLPEGQYDPRQTFHRGHTWEERTPASFVSWVLS